MISTSFLFIYAEIQGKADVARSKTSTGLGLSIAKELVSRMDGEIEAKIEKKEFIVEMNFPIVTDAK